MLLPGNINKHLLYVRIYVYLSKSQTVGSLWWHEYIPNWKYILKTHTHTFFFLHCFSYHILFSHLILFFFFVICRVYSFYVCMPAEYRFSLTMFKLRWRQTPVFVWEWSIYTYNALHIGKARRAGILNDLSFENPAEIIGIRDLICML